MRKQQQRERMGSGPYQKVRRACALIAMGKCGGRHTRIYGPRLCAIFTAIALITYCILTSYAISSLWYWNHEGQTQNLAQKNKIPLYLPSHVTVVDIEVWGKAAIGLYFWEHILKGPLVKKLDGIWYYGEKRIESLRFKFRTGGGVGPKKVPQDTKNLVLILNGREERKVKIAKAWLDALSGFKMLKNVAVVLLGNEYCDNEWLDKYMWANGGLVKVAFIVYDVGNRDDSTYYQWPLGVATYRNFPNVMPISVDVEKRRKYICNFLGTLYGNSSRVILKRVLDTYELSKQCYVKYREKWLSKETKETTRQYHYALANSDLTLCPVGINTECYRIYEACSYGSVPVIEDVLTTGHCGKGKDSALHLLKKYKAPFIFIKSWAELPRIIEREKEMSDYELSDRRKMIIRWYTKFKEQIRLHFIQTLVNKFEF